MGDIISKMKKLNLISISQWNKDIVYLHAALIVVGYITFKVTLPLLSKNLNGALGFEGVVFFISEFIAGISAISIWSGYFGKKKYSEYFQKVLSWINVVILLVIWDFISGFSVFYSQHSILYGLMAGYVATLIFLLILRIVKKDFI